MPPAHSRASLAPFENVEDLPQLTLDGRDRLELEGRSRDAADFTLAAVLVDLLACAFDRVFLGVQEVLHELDELHFTALVDTVAGAVLGRAEKLELALPIPQDVRLEIGELTNLTDRIELLHRLLRRGARRHYSGSARSSRVI